MTTVWLPTIREVIYEAAERARIDPLTITATMFWSAQRTLNAIFTSWQNQDVRSGLVTGQATLALVAGTTSYSLPADCAEILEAALRRDSIDVEMQPISRDEYLAIPNKSVRGRPDRYYTERLPTPTTPLKLWLWLVPENSTDTIRYNYLRIPSDVGTDMSVSPEIARLWADALFDELAHRMYQKFGSTAGGTDTEGPKDRWQFDARFYTVLKSNAAESFRIAKGADRQRANVKISVGFGARR